MVSVERRFIFLKAILKNKEKNKGKYPDAVFVITDGYGDPVKPEFCKKWYWFLSHNYRACIPKECNVYDLKNYE